MANSIYQLPLNGSIQQADSNVYQLPMGGYIVQTVATGSPNWVQSGIHPGRTPVAMARFMQTRQGATPAAAAATTTVFRKTLSQIGSRTGSRQTHH